MVATSCQHKISFRMHSSSIYMENRQREQKIKIPKATRKRKILGNLSLRGAPITAPKISAVAKIKNVDFLDPPSYSTENAIV